MAMAAETLLVDIIAADILPRLPVKSLLRFKCVCKYFKTLIATPEFIYRHLRHSLSSDDSRLLVLIRELLGVHSYHLDSPYFHSVNLVLPREIGWNHFAMVGSCNGLVCVAMSHSSLIIFNPSTAIFGQVSLKNDAVCVNYGFGFDAINDDYKIVRIKAYMSNDDDGFVGMRRDIDVYSLKSDSWSLVERKYNQDPMERLESGTLINNHLLHWMFWNPLNQKYRIGCFNLQNNLWGDDVPLPDYCAEIGSIGALDGSLCLLINYSQSIDVDLWVMNEYGIKDSWVKLVSIRNNEVCQPLRICPFAYAKGSKTEILVRMHSGGSFFWFNIRDKTWRSAEMHLASAYPEACMGKESLVGIPGGLPFQLVQELSSRNNTKISIDCMI